MCNAAVSACMRGGPWQRKWEILPGMESGCMPRNTNAPNAAVRACVKGGQRLLAFEPLAEMLSGWVQWDAIIHNAAVRDCGKGGIWLQEFLLWAGMAHGRVQQNFNTYSAVVCSGVEAGPAELVRECVPRSTIAPSAAGGVSRRAAKGCWRWSPWL